MGRALAAALTGLVAAGMITLPAVVALVALAPAAAPHLSIPSPPPISLLIQLAAFMVVQCPGRAFPRLERAFRR